MNKDKWIVPIDQITRSFVQKFGGLTAEQLNWKPNDKTWSIAQNIQHLIIVNESYFPIITAVKNGTYKPPFIARFDFLVDLMGTTLLKAVQPATRKKRKTFSMWEPGSSSINGDVLTRFEEHQSTLKEVIKDCVDLIDKKQIISSPVTRNIVYRLDVAFDIIVAHEQRHFEQAKEVATRMH